MGDVIAVPKPLEIRSFDSSLTDAVLALWHEVFPEYRDPTKPQRDPRRSIEQKMKTQPELFFIVLIDDRLAGTVMAGYDGHRGWLYSLAVAPSLRRRGIGRALVAHAEQALAERGCPKVNLQVLQAKGEIIDFYEALGYRADAVVSLGKRIGSAA